MLFILSAGQKDFYPRPPRGGRRQESSHTRILLEFLSTPSARRATFTHRPFAPLARFLSTPSARRATLPAGARTYVVKISIHALREEGDPEPTEKTEAKQYFYPRPPRGGRQ